MPHSSCQTDPACDRKSQRAGDGVAAGLVAGGEADKDLVGNGVAGLAEAGAAGVGERAAGRDAGDGALVLGGVVGAGGAAQFVAGQLGVAAGGPGEFGAGIHEVVGAGEGDGVWPGSGVSRGRKPPRMDEVEPVCTVVWDPWLALAVSHGDPILDLFCHV